mmetsp:Transcript_65272/g.164545  ORF Transcript_65272/g.164545 Transcript_65272/m.164545 type:complete len:288 (+) Transcript_65272:234-1097(+)
MARPGCLGGAVGRGSHVAAAERRLHKPDSSDTSAADMAQGAPRQARPRHHAGLPRPRGPPPGGGPPGGCGGRARQGVAGTQARARARPPGLDALAEQPGDGEAQAREKRGGRLSAQAVPRGAGGVARRDAPAHAAVCKQPCRHPGVHWPPRRGRKIAPPSLGRPRGCIRLWAQGHPRLPRQPRHAPQRLRGREEGGRGRETLRGQPPRAHRRPRPEAPGGAARSRGPRGGPRGLRQRWGSRPGGCTGAAETGGGRLRAGFRARAPRHDAGRRRPGGAAGAAGEAQGG